MRIPIDNVRVRQPIEKWLCIGFLPTNQSIRFRYPLMYTSAETSKNLNITPSIRVKAKYQSVKILPLQCYNELVTHIERHYTRVCDTLEGALSAKTKVIALNEEIANRKAFKEDMATVLVRVLCKRGSIRAFLSDVIMREVESLGTLAVIADISHVNTMQTTTI